MPLLNYTTTVPVGRSAGQVQGLLVEVGARAIMVTYDDVGHATGLAFTVATGYGQRTFRLPVNAEKVEVVMRRDKAVPRRFKTPEQAERVAWRILKDWVEAQVAIIRTEMVTLDQVMLPYMQGDNGQTIYDLYVGQQLALPAGADQ